MDKVRIQEIADEAGLSNGELLGKAKELGYNVKAANSSISMEEAGILVDYAISGTLPKGFKKPAPKSKITIVKKKTEEEKDTHEAPLKEEVSEIENITSEAESVIGKESEAKEEEVPEVKEIAKTESTAPSSGIQKSAKKSAEPRVSEGETTEPQTETAKSTEVEKKSLKKKSLSRGGITIVRKAKRAPVKKKISMADTIPAVPKKKKVKRAAEAKESGEKLNIMVGGDFGGSDEIYDDAEVVLLDFSDKNIYEEMKRQDERRKAEQKKSQIM